MADTSSQVFSGARAILKIGGQTVGYCLAMTGNTAINYQPIEACGNLAVLEHVPIGYTVEMTAQLSRLANFTRLANQTDFHTPPNSAAATAKQSPRVMPVYGLDGSGILKSGELTAVIQDVVLNKAVFTIKGVKCTSKAWDVSGRAPVAENCNFVARYMVEDQEDESALGELA
jgi:hypothetical protein